MTARRQQIRPVDMKTPEEAAARLQVAFDEVQQRIDALPQRELIDVEFRTETPVADTPPIGLPAIGAARGVRGITVVQSVDLSTSPPTPWPSGTVAFSRNSAGQYELTIDGVGPLLNSRPYRFTLEVIYG